MTEYIRCFHADGVVDGEDRVCGGETVRYAHLAPAHKLAAVDKLAKYRREQEKVERSKIKSIDTAAA